MSCGGISGLAAAIYPEETQVAHAYLPLPAPRRLTTGATEETLDRKFVSPLIYVTAADTLPSATTNTPTRRFARFRFFRRSHRADTLVCSKSPLLAVEHVAQRACMHPSPRSSPAM